MPVSEYFCEDFDMIKKWISKEVRQKGKGLRWHRKQRNSKGLKEVYSHFFSRGPIDQVQP